MRAIVPLLAAILVTEITSQSPFVHKDTIRRKGVDETDTRRHSGSRVYRETNNADQMVQNILQWIQEVYNTKSRKTRQQSGMREYLPPNSNTQRPRPFQPNTQLPAVGGQAFTGYPYPASNPTGYPYPGTSPSPSFSEGPAPDAGAEENGIFPATGYPPATYPPTTRYPASTRFPPAPSTEFTSRPVETTRFTTSTGYTYTSGQVSTGFTTPPTIPSTIYTNPTTQYPTRQSTQTPYTTRPSTTQYTTPGYQTIPTRPPYETERPEPEGGESENTGTGIAPGIDEDYHPPHIHAIDVECAKDMMTINIELNKPYNGIIYSKGHYSNPECRYVSENSNQIKFTFTVRLDSCGTEFINAFDTQGQSYLENVLVLQNEAGIQEAWDSVRSVRCLWEGNLNKALSIALSVGMLQQEVVTFSGDTAMARLDIQLGRGPFAPTATGLVKIGDIMTLVVSVTGDPGFDIQVRDCRARDSDGTNTIQLTDTNGCVLKPKVFGAFQKTRNTENTGASIIAYAFFSAFKFPDVMDLILECNVELCKTDCEACPYPDQSIEPGGHTLTTRRRRDVAFDLAKYNSSRSNPEAAFTIGRGLKVFLPEDISDSSLLLTPSNQLDQICVSSHTFILASTILICLLTVSCIFSAYIWLKSQRSHK